MKASKSQLDRTRLVYLRSVFLTILVLAESPTFEILTLFCPKIRQKMATKLYLFRFVVDCCGLVKGALSTGTCAIYSIILGSHWRWYC